MDNPKLPGLLCFSEVKFLCYSELKFLCYSSGNGKPCISSAWYGFTKIYLEISQNSNWRLSKSYRSLAGPGSKLWHLQEARGLPGEILHVVHEVLRPRAGHKLGGTIPSLSGDRTKPQYSAGFQLKGPPQWERSVDWLTGIQELPYVKWSKPWFPVDFLCQPWCVCDFVDPIPAQGVYDPLLSCTNVFGFKPPAPHKSSTFRSETWIQKNHSNPTTSTTWYILIYASDQGECRYLNIKI